MSNESSDPERQRLSKRVMAERACSRSEAERLIVGGRVRVDGQLVEAPETRVSPTQSVSVDDSAAMQPVAPVTVLWHKPSGVLLPDGELLPEPLALQWLSEDTRAPGERQGGAVLKVQRRHLRLLWPLGGEESGLMVFSQAQGVQRRLSEEAQRMEQEWLIDLAGEVPVDAAARAELMARLSVALAGDGLRTFAARASWQSEYRIRVAIKGCVPGLIGQALDRAGLRASVQRRQRLGRVSVAGLAEGQWRHLLATERF